MLEPLDDSTAHAAAGTRARPATTPALAVADPTTIGYLGDSTPGPARSRSRPQPRRDPAGQPDQHAVGLTSAGPGAAPGEPEKYYPTGIRTFARVVPNDARRRPPPRCGSSGAAGCRRTYVVDDGEVDGEDLAEQLRSWPPSAAGLHVVGTQEFDPRATDYRSLAAAIAQQPAPTAC